MSKSSFLQNYFGFNKQQRNGLYVLVIISFTLLLIRIVYPYFIKPNDITIANLPLAEQKLDSVFANTHKKQYSAKAFDQQPSTSKLFVFDPNTVSFEQLVALGFKEKNAKTFLKFRGKGFVFKEKEDLKKIYGVSDYLYSRLAPYIQIADKKPEAVIAERIPAKEAVVEKLPAKIQSPAIFTKIELNTADSLALVQLPGIGPVFAKRILKYRSLLGGYVSVEQLKEVYGFSEELY